MTLGLQSPWQVNEISFFADESTRKQFHLHIGFARGSRFPDEAGIMLLNSMSKVFIFVKFSNGGEKSQVIVVIKFFKIAVENIRADGWKTSTVAVGI